jgi:phage tail-like protein
MRLGKLVAALVGTALVALAIFGALASSSKGAGAGVGSGQDHDALTAARFELSIDGVSIAVFGDFDHIISGYEPSALELSARRLSVPNKRTPPRVTLTRGMTTGMEMWAWHDQALRDLNAAKKNAMLTMYNTAGSPVARYHLENAWPAKVEIGGLLAGASIVLMETVTIVAEDIQRVAP